MAAKIRKIRKGTVRKVYDRGRGSEPEEQMSKKKKCICKEKVDRKTCTPCDECGVRGCNIHQLLGWARPPGVDYRADCPVHGEKAKK
jgi:hypothetical protein